MLNRKRALPLKPTPPPFRNHGNYVVSVAELNRWLGERAEEAGAYVLSETVGAKLLVDDGTVVGVRTGDKGRDKQGGREVELRAGLRRDRPRDRARRGLLGPPDRRRAEGPRARRRPTRRSGRSASRRSGRSSSRSIA